MTDGPNGRFSRRGFVKGTVAAAALSVAPPALGRAGAAEGARDLARRLREAQAAPVLRKELLPRPVILSSVELLRSGRFFLVRARSADGAVGLAEGHGPVLESAWPILVQRVAPFFGGKDARELDALVDGVYLDQSNYKWQGLPFWACVASVELAVLDLLGQVSGRSLGDLLGGVRRREIAVYRASSHRGNSPEEELDYLRRVVEEDGATALKFRLGGRMRYDAETTRRDQRPHRGDAQGVRRRGHALRRRQRLVRRPDGRRDRAGHAGPRLPLLRGAGALRPLRGDEGRWRTPSRSPSREARRKPASGSSGG